MTSNGASSSEVRKPQNRGNRKVQRLRKKQRRAKALKVVAESSNNSEHAWENIGTAKVAKPRNLKADRTMEQRVWDSPLLENQRLWDDPDIMLENLPIERDSAEVDFSLTEDEVLKEHDIPFYGFMGVFPGFFPGMHAIRNLLIPK